MSGHGDNGGERTPDGNDLPGLPPEWGSVTVPDDASALESDAAWIRRHFRRQARRNRWRRRFGRPPVYQRVRGGRPTTLTLPLLILAMAVTATLTSLFAVVWPNHPRVSAAPSAPTPAVAASTLPDVSVQDASGHDVRLRGRLPAVLLLLRGCGCADLVRATTLAARTTITVIVLGTTVPVLPSGLPGGQPVLAARDGSHTVLDAFPGRTAGTGAAVVLVTAGGNVTGYFPDVSTVDPFRSALSELS